MGKAKRPTLHRINFPGGLEIPDEIDPFGVTSHEAFRNFLDGKISEQGAEASKLSPGQHLLGPKDSSRRELQVVTAQIAKYRHLNSRAMIPPFNIKVEVEAGVPVEIPRDAEALAVVAETRKGLGVFDIVLPKVYKVPEVPPLPQNLATVF